MAQVVLNDYYHRLETKCSKILKEAIYKHNQCLYKMQKDENTFCAAGVLWNNHIEIEEPFAVPLKCYVCAKYDKNLSYDNMYELCVHLNDLHKFRFNVIEEILVGLGY